MLEPIARRVEAPEYMHDQALAEDIVAALWPGLADRDPRRPCDARAAVANALSGSLDRALWIREVCLPDWEWEFSCGAMQLLHPARLRNKTVNQYSRNPSPARALLAAVLRARAVDPVPQDRKADEDDLPVPVDRPGIAVTIEDIDTGEGKTIEIVDAAMQITIVVRPYHNHIHVMGVRGTTQVLDVAGPPPIVLDALAGR